MPAKKKTAKKTPRPAERKLFIGCFSATTPVTAKLTEDVSFQVLVATTSPEDALQEFAERLQQMRARVLSDVEHVFLDDLIELPLSVVPSVLVNYRSLRCGAKSPHVMLGAACPSGQPAAALVYGIGDDEQAAKDEAGEGYDEVPFLTFARPKAAAKRKKAVRKPAATAKRK